jgi:hypothetical protein
LALEFNAAREEEQGNKKEGEAALHEPTLPNRCRMHKAEGGKKRGYIRYKGYIVT